MINNSYVVVIGAANIDIGGTPYDPLIPENSNPGRITISQGGVGRNIAHNLVNLGVDVKFITAVGGDPLGKDLINSCRKMGMDVICSSVIDGYPSSIYMYINNDRGDMQLALSDMDVCRNISPEYLDKYEKLINGAGAVVADCNLTRETLLHIREMCRVPVYIDTVSVNKADKIKNNLDGFYAIKPNRLEASHLTDINIECREDCIAAADKMLEQGVSKVFLSMGSDGMIAADSESMYIVGHCRANVKCTTGAGDSSTAAIVWASVLNENKDILTAAKAANAAAAMTIEVNEAINNDISASTMIHRINSTDFKVEKIR